jgi:hypothetical protein
MSERDFQTGLMVMVWSLITVAGGKVTVPKAIVESFDPARAMIDHHVDPVTGDYHFEAVLHEADEATTDAAGATDHRGEVP